MHDSSWSLGTRGARALRAGGSLGAGGAAPIVPAQAAGPSVDGYHCRQQDTRAQVPVRQEHSGREVLGWGGASRRRPRGRPARPGSLFCEMGDRETFSQGVPKGPPGWFLRSAVCSPGTSRHGPGLREPLDMQVDSGRTHSCVHGTHTSPAHQRPTFLQVSVACLGAPLFRPKALPAPRSPWLPLAHGLSRA